MTAAMARSWLPWFGRCAQIIARARRRREDLQIARICGACAAGDVEKIQRLVSSSNTLDVNTGDLQNRRPLHLAASYGHEKAIEILLALKADPNVEDKMGSTPLADAVRHHHDAAARLLHQYGGQRPSRDVAERLCEAASSVNGAERLVRLLSFDVDVNTRNYEKRTPLHLAAAEGHEQNVKLLLERGADPNARDGRGFTALQDAFRAGHDHCSKLLLDADASMGKFDEAGALCFSASTDNVHHLKRLVEHKCNVNASNYDQRTALHLAASNGSVACMHFLLKQQVIEVNVEDRFGNTPLDDARRVTDTHGGVVEAMLRTVRSAPGRHRRLVAAEFENAEEKKAQADSMLVVDQEKALGAATEVSKTLRAHLASARRLRKVVEESAALETEEGAVLTSARPQLFVDLREFALGQMSREQWFKQTMSSAIANIGAHLEQLTFADAAQEAVRCSGDPPFRREGRWRMCSRAIPRMSPLAAHGGGGASWPHARPAGDARRRNLQARPGTSPIAARQPVVAGLLGARRTSVNDAGNVPTVGTRGEVARAQWCRWREGEACGGVPSGGNGAHQGHAT